MKEVFMNLYSLKNKWILLYAIMALAFFVRAFHFFYNRGLYIDEASVAVNVITKDFAQLADPPLMYDQQAPIVFWWLEKISVLLFGTGERALRFFPLLFGLASLPLFWVFLRKHIGYAGSIMGLILLCFSYPVIYHSVEAKQYSMEMFTTVAMLYLFSFRDTYTERRFGILNTVVGVIVVWMSYSSVFVLVAVGIVQFSEYLIKKRKIPFSLILQYGLWMVSFILNYIFFVSKGTRITWIIDFFEDNYMPWPLFNVKGFYWILNSFNSFLDYPLGVSWSFWSYYTVIKHSVLIGCLFFGMFFCYKKKHQSVLFNSYGHQLIAFGFRDKKISFYREAVGFFRPLSHCIFRLWSGWNCGRHEIQKQIHGYPDFVGSLPSQCVSFFQSGFSPFGSYKEGL